MKTIKRVIALFSAACVLAACGASDAASADQLRQIQDKGVIVIGTEGTYAPNSYHDEEGNLTGFDVEVGRLIARELDVPHEAVRKWLLTYKAMGLEGLMEPGAGQARYDFETKVAAAKAVVE